MSQIMNTVFQLLSLILSLVAILGIFLFVFTIIGMRLYGGRYVHCLCIVRKATQSDFSLLPLVSSPDPTRAERVW